MEVKTFVDFGNEILYTGRVYAFAKMNTYTDQERDFVNYLFSDERKRVLNGLDEKIIHPVDIKFFFKIENSEKPKVKPKESQK